MASPRDRYYKNNRAIYGYDFESSTPTKYDGDVLVYSGSHFIRIGSGSAGSVLYVNPNDQNLYSWLQISIDTSGSSGSINAFDLRYVLTSSYNLFKSEVDGFIDAFSSSVVFIGDQRYVLLTDFSSFSSSVNNFTSSQLNYNSQLGGFTSSFSASVKYIGDNRYLLTSSLVQQIVSSSVVFSGTQIISGNLNIYGNTMMSGPLDMGHHDINSVNIIHFDITPTDHAFSEGSLYWNNQDRTLNVDTDVSGTTIQIGQENVVRVINKTGVLINNGEVVYVSGAQGNRPTVWLADADFEVSSDQTIGLATNDIPDNQNGYITTFGLVRDVDASGAPVGEIWSEGDLLWVSSTAGRLTNIEPHSPKHAIKVGHVISNHAVQGIILVSVVLGPELDEIHDVLVTNIKDGNILSYHSSSGLWKNNGSNYDLSGTVHISGNLEIDGLRGGYKEVLSTYTINTNDFFIKADATSGSFGVTLPTAVGKQGKQYSIKKVDNTTNEVTVSASVGQFIDSDVKVIINYQWNSMSVISDGTKWLIF